MVNDIDSKIVARGAFSDAPRIQVSGMMVADSRLTDGAYRTLHWLMFRGGGKGICYASNKVLAEDRGVDVATLYRHFDELVNQKWLEIVRGGNGEVSCKIISDQVEVYPIEDLMDVFDLCRKSRSHLEVQVLRSEIKRTNIAERRDGAPKPDVAIKPHGDSQECETDVAIIRDHPYNNEEDEGSRENNNIGCVENPPPVSLNDLFDQRVKLANDTIKDKTEFTRKARGEKLLKRKSKEDGGNGKVKVKGDRHGKVYNIAKVYSNEFARQWPDVSMPKWGHKEWGQAKNLVAKLGEEMAVKLIEKVFTEWDKYSQLWEIPGYPTIAVILGYGHPLVIEIQTGKPVGYQGKPERKRTGEFNKEASAGDSW